LVVAGHGEGVSKTDPTKKKTVQKRVKTGSIHAGERGSCRNVKSNPRRGKSYGRWGKEIAKNVVKGRPNKDELFGKKK